MSRQLSSLVFSSGEKEEVILEHPMLVLCFKCFTCRAGAKGRFCGGFDITAFGKKPSKNEAVFP